GTGHTNVAAMTREGYHFVWGSSGNGCAGNSESWHWHQNEWNNGRYGTDTRPPAAVNDLTVTQSGANDILKFTAVGDNWHCGSPAKYQLFTSSTPITQANVYKATRITLSASCCPGASGTAETVTIPASANKGFLAIRAVDHVNHAGPIPVSTTTTPLTAQLNMAVGPVVAVGLFAAVGVIARRR